MYSHLCLWVKSVHMNLVDCGNYQVKFCGIDKVTIHTMFNTSGRMKLLVYGIHLLQL